MKKRTIIHRLVAKLEVYGTFNFLPDEAFLKLMYWARMGKRLNLNNPQTFTEKLQWLKLHNRKSEYTLMVDKYEVKKYVSDRIGEQYIIPTIGVWDSFDQIDFDLLPDQFVLKCTHDSGGLVICRDKSTLDLEAARNKINRSLKSSFYLHGREWPYKNVKPRIIAEQYMEEPSGDGLKDYKFFCFGGVMKCFKIDFDRFIEHHANYYDAEKKILHFGEAAYPPKYDKNLEMPDNIDSMIELAETLSKGIPFLRADFYDIDGRIYFGECTFYPAGGMGRFTSDEWDNILGNWITLPGGAMLILNEVICYVKNQSDIRRKDKGIQSGHHENTGLNDYKVFCFNGIPRITLVCADRFSEGGLKEDFYDEEWKHLDIKRPRHPNAAVPADRPRQYDSMRIMAGKLSENIPFSRVDFYEVGNEIYFGEITFFPSGGFEGFVPEKWDLEFGQWIDLPEN